MEVQRIFLQLITHTHTTRYYFSGWEISLSQRPLPDNTHQLQQTSMARRDSNHNLSKRAATGTSIS
jgi:hypothetical protein